MKLKGWTKDRDDKEVQRWVNSDGSVAVRVDRMAPQKYYLTINNKQFFETILDKKFTKKESALNKAYQWMKNHPGDRITGRDFGTKYPELKSSSDIPYDITYRGHKFRLLEVYSSEKTANWIVYNYQRRGIKALKRKFGDGAGNWQYAVYIEADPGLVSETDLSGKKRGQTRFNVKGKSPNKSRKEKTVSVEARNKRKKKTKQGGLELIGLRRSDQKGLKQF